MVVNINHGHFVRLDDLGHLENRIAAFQANVLGFLIECKNDAAVVVVVVSNDYRRAA